MGKKRAISHKSESLSFRQRFGFACRYVKASLARPQSMQKLHFSQIQHEPISLSALACVQQCRVVGHMQDSKSRICSLRTDLEYLPTNCRMTQILKMLLGFELNSSSFWGNRRFIDSTQR